jgi:hypothetical protein
MVASFAVQLPATETTSERVASKLKTLFTKPRLSAADDLNVAQLTIRLHKQWHMPQ